MLDMLECVEVEIHSACNRTCLWCPNKEFNRDFYEEMPEETYLALLGDLRNSNFQGMISFNRFNEPFYNVELFKKRVRQAREIMPAIHLQTNTNGDFITEEALKDLYLDNLFINDYDCVGISVCKERLFDWDTRPIDLKENANYTRIIATHPNIPRIEYRVNWPLTAGTGLEDRAGYFKPDQEILFQGKPMKWRGGHELRTYPCVEPALDISVSWNGYVFPCCHHNQFVENHGQNCMGNIMEQPLSILFHNKKFTDFRKMMLSDDYRSYPDTCKYCQKRNGYHNLDLLVEDLRRRV